MNWQDKLAPFVELNADVKIESAGDKIRIVNPWRDDTVRFEFPFDKIDEFADVLNYLILPSRFSAIYH